MGVSRIKHFPGDHSKGEYIQNQLAKEVQVEEGGRGGGESDGEGG